MRTTILIAGALAAFACQSQSESTESDAGAIQLAVAAAPQGTACLRVTVAGGSGAADVRTFDLTPGSPTEGTLGGLPVGMVGVRAEALDVACGAVNAASAPSWLSEPVSVLLTAGTTVPVKLVMKRAGQISVSVDWSTGGANGSGGTGTAGTGGAGASGTAGAAGAAGAGGAPQLNVAPLNGKLLRAPCRTDTAASVCQTVVAACPAPNPVDPALSGALLTDNTFTLGGTLGTPYTITLHVQGEVEAKAYPGSLDQNNAASSPRADGFAIGGAPTAADAYGVWMIRVTNPGGAKTDYFLNSLVGPGVSNHTTYGIDYTAAIKAEGGATIRLVASDANCSEVKNCGPTPNVGNVCAAPIVVQNVEPAAVASNPTFDFQAPYNGQWISLVVTQVTTP